MYVLETTSVTHDLEFIIVLYVTVGKWL